MHQMLNQKIDLVVKIWLAFVALMVIGTVGTSIYLVSLVVQAGPEGIGRAIGEVAKGVREGMK